MKRFIIFILLALLILSCGNRPEIPPRLLVVFIDVSGSIPEGERKLYQAFMDTIINSLSAGDKLVIAKISDKTLRQFVPVYRKELPKYSFWMNNPLTHKRQLKAIRDSVAIVIQNLFAQAEKSPATEIIMSFLVSAEEFRAWQGRKRLVILSDMIEYSEDLNLEKLAARLTPTRVQQILERLREKNRIARLESVGVWIAGATAKTTDEYFGIKAFWEKYIEATGATLEHYSHDIGDFR